MRTTLLMSVLVFASMAHANSNYTPQFSNPTNYGKVFHCDDGTTETVEQVMTWEAAYRQFSIPEYLGTTADEKFEDLLAQRITQHTLAPEPLEVHRTKKDLFANGAFFLPNVELPLIDSELFPEPANCVLKQLAIRDSMNEKEIIVNKDLWDLMTPNQQATYFIYFYFRNTFSSDSEQSIRWKSSRFVSDSHNQELVLDLLRANSAYTINLADGTLINLSSNRTSFYQDNYDNGTVSLMNINGKQVILNNFRLSRIYQLQPQNLQIQGKLVSLNQTLLLYDTGAICGGYLVRPVILETDQGQEIIIDEDLWLAFDRSQMVVSSVAFEWDAVQTYCDENFDL